MIWSSEAKAPKLSSYKIFTQGTDDNLNYGKPQLRYHTHVIKI